MRFTTSLNKFTESNASVYALHFPVPLEIAEPFIDGENRRIKCTINNTHTISSGLMPFKEYWYILVNQSLQKELQIEVGDSVELLIEKADLSI